MKYIKNYRSKFERKNNFFKGEKRKFWHKISKTEIEIDAGEKFVKANNFCRAYRDYMKIYCQYYLKYFSDRNVFSPLFSPRLSPLSLHPSHSLTNIGYPVLVHYTILTKFCTVSSFLMGPEKSPQKSFPLILNGIFPLTGRKANLTQHKI